MVQVFVPLLIGATALVSFLWNEAVGFYASTGFATAELDAAESGTEELAAEEGESAAVFQLVSLAAPNAAMNRAEVSETRRVDAPWAGRQARSVRDVDSIHYKGRVYLAVRVAPSPLASAESVVEILSSEDEIHWRSETRFATGAEVRSPRLLEWSGKLFVYVSELEANRQRLNPRTVFASELGENGLWSEFRALDLEGHVVSKTKVERGVPLMTSYGYAEKTYAFDEGRLEVRLLTTADGYTWQPLQHGRKAVYQGGGKETAFSSDDDGSLYSVVQSRAGDQAGFGSALCSAPAGDWSAWDCVKDQKKYDSPTLFTHGKETYLLARRHLGAETVPNSLLQPALLKKFKSEAADLTAPKRCSLWRFDRGKKQVRFVLDLPSRGDTCSPAVVAGPRADEIVVYDHSSEVKGPDQGLHVAQTAPTYIYRHVLRL